MLILELHREGVDSDILREIAFEGMIPVEYPEQNLGWGQGGSCWYRVRGVGPKTFFRRDLRMFSMNRQISVSLDKSFTVSESEFENSSNVSTKKLNLAYSII